jgi:hypothetical protein
MRINCPSFVKHALVDEHVLRRREKGVFQSADHCKVSLLSTPLFSFAESLAMQCGHRQAIPMVCVPVVSAAMLTCAGCVLRRGS